MQHDRDARESTTETRRASQRAGAMVTALTMAALSACSAHKGTTATTSDGGTDSLDPGTGEPVATANDTGDVMDYDIPSKPVAGATLTEGEWSTTTDAKGHFELAIPLNTPVSLVMTAPNYTKTLLAEISLQQDADRGVIPFPLLDTYHLGQQALASFDTSKGTVYLVVRKRGTCTTVAGGTVTVNSPSGALVAYFHGAIPSVKQTEFLDQLPVAAVYNVPAGEQLDITINHPTCKQAPFPVTEGGVTYTGKITVEGGDANSSSTYYLE